MPRRNTRSPYEPERHGRPAPIVVRDALPDDALAIAHVDVEREDRPPAELAPLVRAALERAARDERAFTCVGVVGGRIAGYGKCAYKTWKDAGGSSVVPDGWYLTGVEVDRSHRRMGIGRALTARRLEWLRERTDVVYYFTGEGNRPSIDLHWAFGFVEVARGLALPLPPPFSNEEPHILHRKFLGR